MSRSLNSAALASIYAETTDEVWLELLEITHDDLATPFRLVNNNEDITSNGNVYTAFAFRARLPQQVEKELTKFTITLDNVSRLLIEELRTVSTSPQIALSIVLASDPDTVEAGPFNFVLKTISYDALTIEADLSNEDYHTEPFPFQRFTPLNFPGLFKRVVD